MTGNLEYIVRFTNYLGHKKYFGPFTSPDDAYDAAAASVIRKKDLSRYEVSFSGLNRKIMVSSPEIVPYRFDVMKADNVPYGEQILSSGTMDKVEKVF